MILDHGGSSRRARLGRASLLAGLACLLACGGGVPASSEIPSIVEQAARGESGPAFGDSPARRALRAAFRAAHQAETKNGDEIARRFRRPELQSYLLLDDSFVGGTFPAGTAVLLREVHQLETEMVSDLEAFPVILARQLDQAELPDSRRKGLEADALKHFEARWRPLIVATEAHAHFVEEAAELYELVAAQPESIQSMRDGIKISDDALLDRFNEQVDRVNAAIDAAERTLPALDARQQDALRRMGLVKRVRR